VLSSLFLEMYLFLSCSFCYTKVVLQTQDIISFFRLLGLIDFKRLKIKRTVLRTVLFLGVLYNQIKIQKVKLYRIVSTDRRNKYLETRVQ